MQLLINLYSIERVKKFVNIASKYKSEIDVCEGKYIVDGKSIIGIFSLNLLKPVIVKINSEDREEIAKFIIETKEFR